MFPRAVYEGPNFSTASDTLVIICLVNIVILVGVRWYLLLVLICISLMVMVLSISSCGYWLFVYLLWKFTYPDPLHTFNWVISLFIFSCKNYLCILDARSLSDIWLANSPPLGYLFIFFIVSFEAHKFFIMMKAILSIFLLLLVLLMSYL